MKSKIWIDVDHDNQPIIRINWNDSEDVRDKLVCRFLETFQYDSCWADFSFENAGTEIGKIAKLRPIPPEGLKDTLSTMSKTVELLSRNHEKPQS